MWSVNYATSSVSSWNFSECENFFSKIVREAHLLCNFIRADLSDASHSLPQYCHDLTLTGMKMRWLSQNQFPELSRYNTHQWRRTMHVAIHYFQNCKLSHYLFMVHKPPGNAATHWSLIRWPNRLNPQSNIFPISLSRCLWTAELCPQKCHIRGVLAKPLLSSLCLRLCLRGGIM